VDSQVWGFFVLFQIQNQKALGSVWHHAS
jgi:hypothetical protein